MPKNNDGSNKNPGELVQWINPDSLEYKSTDRQKAFRRWTVYGGRGYTRACRMENPGRMIDMPRFGSKRPSKLRVLKSLENCVNTLVATLLETTGGCLLLRRSICGF